MEIKKIIATEDKVLAVDDEGNSYWLKTICNGDNYKWVKIIDSYSEKANEEVNP